MGKRARKHGASGRDGKQNKTPEYRVWCGMNERCNDSGYHEYHLYGGRGIRVCERWTHFEAFLSDMGPRPRGHSIDRIDNTGNYEPANCRWADARTQNRNKRTTVWVKFKGERLCLADLAEKVGIKYSLLRSRIKRGVPVELAVKP
jgi:hypothetical protein